MAEVHEALKALAPAPHSDFPQSKSTLDVHLTNHLLDVHTLISSIPPPEILPADLHLPEPPNADSKTLQKEWKPVKMSTKDNPLGISVFKLSAKDGRGSWFARRSIHTDIPFSRFKAGLQKEFDEPKREGTSAIRGIGKNETVQNQESELGKAEVIVLSAQFPGPSAPRMFVEGYISTSAHAEDFSASTGQSTSQVPNSPSSAASRPKQFTVISKPVIDHPDVEEKPGHVLGQYESVEFIREVPMDPKHIDRSQSFPNVASAADVPTSPTRRRGKTVGSIDEPRSGASIPVEWIMITRSDPGGSVPRWMVERGTPNGIVKDAEKFIKWCRDAHHLDEAPEASMDQITDQTAQGQVAHTNPEIRSEARKHLAGQGVASPSSSTSTVLAKDHAQGQLPPSSSSEAQRSFSSLRTTSDGSSEVSSESTNHSNSGGGGILSSLTAGMTSLASSAIGSTTSTKPSTHTDAPPSNAPSDDAPPGSAPPDNAPTIHTPPPSDHIPTPPATNATESDTDPLSSGSDTASIGSFATCLSQDDLSHQVSDTPTPDITATPEAQALQQFLKEKAKLEEKLRREEAKRMEKERKTTEKHLRNLEKRERKFRRAVEKAEEKKRREAGKLKRAKEEARDNDGHLHIGVHPGRKEGWREVESLKKVVEELTKENIELKQRVEQLEKENGALLGRV